jgi:hypothetical protein
MDCTDVDTAKVFQAIQGHWMSASLGVMLQLKIADILLDHQAGRQAAAAQASSELATNNSESIGSGGAVVGNGTAAANHMAHAVGSTNAPPSCMPIKQVIHAAIPNKPTPFDEMISDDPHALPCYNHNGA